MADRSRMQSGRSMTDSDRGSANEAAAGGLAAMPMDRGGTAAMAAAEDVAAEAAGLEAGAAAEGPEGGRTGEAAAGERAGSP